MRPRLVKQRRVAVATTAMGFCWAGALLAHGDEPHGASANTRAENITEAAIAPPRQLSLSKPLQRALGITTTTTADAAPQVKHLLGEVVRHPEARSRVQAPETGRLRVAAGAWPVAGKKISRGQLLAVLEPALASRDQAQRRSDLATLEQRQRIAAINVERLQLQSSAAGGLDASGNTYLEQAVQEAETLARQLQLMQQSLAGAVEIRAGEDGVVQRALVAAGEVVTRGQTLFETSGGDRPLLLLRIHDASLTQAGVQASATLAHQATPPQTIPLRPAGYESAAPEPGWNLWLEFADTAPSIPLGTPVPVNIRLSRVAGSELQLLPSASVQGSADQAHVWLHVAPERFVRRPVAVIETRGDLVLTRVVLKPEDRVVENGAALLDQYL